MAQTERKEQVPPAWHGGKEAIASVDHLRKLQRVTDAALANLTVDELLDELLIRVKEALSTDTAAILLIDRGKGDLVARAAKGIEEEVQQGVRIPVGRGFAGTIAASGKPLAIYDVDHSIVLNPILRQKGIHSLLGVPLVVQGQTLGILHVGTLVPRRFTADDTELLQLVGDRIALAVNASLYERERAVARTLQRSLLPDKLPTVPGLHLAGRYVAAGGGDVGGDWYDAFVLPDGSIGVAIGDVVGRGLGAASIMGKLRNILRAYAVEVSSPAEVLGRMNRLLQHLDPDEMATVCYGRIDPVDLTLQFASAGHVPPITREPSGDVRIQKVAGGPPLGAAPSWAAADQTEELRPGSTLILCTDGLIERRGVSLDDGLRRLSEASRVEMNPEQRCVAIIDELVDDELDDDVALLVIEVGPDLGDRWEQSLPAEAGQLRLLRRHLHRWLTERSVPTSTIYDVLVGTGEAAANAIQHAYGPSRDLITVGAEWHGSEITITVRDSGRWRPPRNADRGRGIPMMHALTDEVRVSRSDAGTSVQLRWRLRPR
jgi:anti-sigma regulatory factor (Ser/Thr protein kinase)/putative methionine-R-sulfoxide reductase with GAF domain